ncbi:MAG: type II toxin-antitoxin system HicA family toxin [Methanoregula sp.]|nr:type II toxin-antitoxin system HicA family toxin [Methanoregula sp.]
MSEKLPRITAKKIIPFLEKRGFIAVRQSGSHRIYKNDEGVRVTLPIHSGQVLHPKIIAQICKDADIAPEELR